MDPPSSFYASTSARVRHRERTYSLDEKDKEIAHLHQQLSAHTQRVSHLEYCLLATLDFLDSTRTSASNDLKHANERNVLLQRKLSELEAMNAAAEAEKDDLRDAVLLLVEKVEENNNDFSCLPYARLRTTRTLSLVPQQDPGPSRSRAQTACRCPQAYAPSVFQEMSRQLESERDAHAKTKSDAEENIALLQCAIARRDAEIEKWITSSAGGVPDNSSFRLDRVTPLKRLTEISQEGMRRIDALTSERNELLRTELAVLREKLSREEQGIPSPNSGKTSIRTRLNKGVQVDSTSRSASVRNSSSGSPTLPQRRDKDGADHGNSDNVANALRELDRRLGMLREETHDLQRKRGKLAVTVKERMRSGEGSNEGEVGEVTSSDSDFSRVLSIEDECIRLQQSEKALQEELERARKGAVSRESELEEEIRQLRLALERLKSISAGSPSDFQPSLQLSPVPPAPSIAHDTSHAVTYVSSSPNASVANNQDDTTTHAFDADAIPSSSSGVPSELNASFPPLTPEHLSPSFSIPPNPGLDAISMTETETELDTELADDDASPSSPYPYPGPGAEPENSFSSLSDGERNTADGIDDERFFAEPSSGALSSNDLESHSPAPHRSPQLHGSRQEEAETRPARDIAAIEQELARLREEEERRAREAEELRESIAMLQRIHLQGVRDREE